MIAKQNFLILYYFWYLLQDQITMREYVKKPKSQSRTLDSKPKTSGQVPIDVILQQYREQNIQRYAEDEELIQSKFDTIQSEKKALAYAQGTDIHVAPRQEKYLPHETLHVVQQKQGKVRLTTQVNDNVNNDTGLEKEAGIMSGVALSCVDNKNNETLKATSFLRGVLQRQIIVNDVEVYKDRILDDMVTNTKGSIQTWLTSLGMTATLKRKNELKEEKTATESNSKATKYLDKNLRNQISFLLGKYDSEDRTFTDDTHLKSQLIQDVKLKILRLDDFVGIDHHTGQFSLSDTSGRDKPLRIYRTTTREDWNNYLKSNNIEGLLHGHGGSLGQALDYFYKSKTDDSRQYYDNVIFELTFTQSASSAINYAKISAGGEGGGPDGRKLTGKHENNDIFKEDQVFSVNLTACRNLISSMNPTIRRVDEMKGEDSQYSKRLIELGLKYGEYPPRCLTEAERIELQELNEVDTKII
ncbi:DUF4157 domain-containing protein [Parabacteroides distasonis]|uniref:DUF4157 domain-containing protein n=2 Tax=Parabacteroides distasonis TaxID=823 RepID=UPI001E4FA4E7|nr:DUF4157 domain-containing protein [Parabacteroides distasonis]MDB9150853.1 DUF4157 domain-containing protein [Parabacteroides distasonis]MDB9155176.1 DUF4157 domain-containing protein [Parabacteroides distasonis]MDB9168924.1 DUF4157 domain-containing protein [Parabacteroides distasonis]MDB9197225.1 DUF4157 domain-containing protein [Parabacteroides distasonis]